MKYTVKIADKSYEVDVEDIHARPIIARVAGQEFQVNPENGALPTVRRESNKLEPAQVSSQPSSPLAGTSELTAPLPGTVIEVFFKTGEQIEAGQVVLVIEAMKMKNSIRSTRAGQIAEVLVSAGQTVAHKQVLVRFE